jgi:hypothetical protein
MVRFLSNTGAALTVLLHSTTHLLFCLVLLPSCIYGAILQLWVHCHVCNEFTRSKVFRVEFRRSTQLNQIIEQCDDRFILYTPIWFDLELTASNWFWFLPEKWKRNDLCSAGLQPCNLRSSWCHFRLPSSSGIRIRYARNSELNVHATVLHSSTWNLCPPPQNSSSYS